MSAPFVGSSGGCPCAVAAKPRWVAGAVVRSNLTESCQEVPDTKRRWVMSTMTSEMRCSFCGRLHTEVSKLVAGPGVYICDGCVNLSVDVIAQATQAERLSLPDWAAMSDDQLLQRIPFIAGSAANIEAELRDRVHELRERGVSWARIGAALGMTRQSAWERFSPATT